MSFLLIAVGQIIMGCYILMGGFSRELRQRRPDDAPVIRSDRVDRLVQIACFVLGALFIVSGLFLIVMLIVEWLE